MHYDQDIQRQKSTAQEKDLIWELPYAEEYCRVANEIWRERHSGMPGAHIPEVHLPEIGLPETSHSTS